LKFSLSDRRLYLCTPDRPDLDRFVAACISGGVDVVQLRDKELGDTALVARARVVREICSGEGVPFVVNDRPDLAREAEADGVHLGQEDMSPSDARRMLGSKAIIGRSTHEIADLERASREPVSYISAGPVVPTPTKPGRQGTGIEYVGKAARRSLVPVFVTGGVTPDAVPALAQAGVRHFVVVRWLTESADPEDAARTLRAVIDDALARTSEPDPLRQ